MSRKAEVRTVAQIQADESQLTSDEPVIIQYTNLLHRYRSPRAKEVEDFLRKHKHDAIFVQRAEVLNKVFLLTEQLALR